MGKPSAPPPPDTAGAIRESRYNQFTPFGSQTWTPAQAETQGYWETPPAINLSPADLAAGKRGPQGQTGDPRWVPGTPAVPAGSTVTLDPKIQSALDSQLRLSERMGGLAESSAGQVAGQGPLDLSSVPQVADKAYAALTSRLDPQWSQREQMQKTQLINQGLNAGTEAYDNSMREFNQARNDAYQQANLAAINTMPQTYQLAEAAYNQPLNRLNALRTGAQVNTPQFTPANFDPMQAAALQSQYGLGRYNADVGSYNTLLSGLFGLGAAGIALSDRRLKEGIERIGEDPRGWGIYTYRYIGDGITRTGVMAGEVERVRPEAVLTINGFKAVNYGLLYA